MWYLPDAADTGLRGSHTAVTRVDVLHSGQPVYSLQVVSGNVTADATRPVMRNLACTLVDPTGALSGGDVDDLLNPYDCEVQPWRGVRTTTTRTGITLVPNAGLGLAPFGGSGFGGVDPMNTLVSSIVSDEMAPLGVFGLTSRKVSGDGSIDLEGQDRAMKYQGPMVGALGISGGTPVEEAILRLLATRNPGLSMRSVRTGFTVGPTIFAPDIDVWSEAQKLAASVGGRLFHDRTGQCVFALTGPTTTTPVASWAEGDGLLVTVDRQEDSDTIRNVVIAESTDGAIRVVVEDDDPSSPTYAGGRYGRRPVALTSAYYGSVAQAQQAAASKLAYELGRSETITFTAVPDPRVDPVDVVGVHRPRAGVDHRTPLVASIQLPLTATDPMTVTCRKSVLTPDGHVLQADPGEAVA